MKPMSRREMLSGALGKLKSSQTLPVETKEIVIGGVGDFPVGEKRLIPNFQICIESLPEGIRAKSIQTDGQYFSIKMNQAGKLIVDCSEVWAEEDLFSLIKNEPEKFSKS